MAHQTPPTQQWGPYYHLKLIAANFVSIISCLLILLPSLSHSIVCVCCLNRMILFNATSLLFANSIGLVSIKTLSANSRWQFDGVPHLNINYHHQHQQHQHHNFLFLHPPKNVIPFDVCGDTHVCLSVCTGRWYIMLGEGSDCWLLVFGQSISSCHRHSKELFTRPKKDRFYTGHRARHRHVRCLPGITGSVEMFWQTASDSITYVIGFPFGLLRANET